MSTARELYEKVYNRLKDDNGQSLEGYGHVNHGGGFQNEVLSFQPDSVLDIGCGGGEFVGFLHRAGVTRCVGFDCYLNTDRVLRTPGIEWVTGDISKRLPFRDHEFDIVTAWDVLEHLDRGHLPNAINEMVRVAHNRVMCSVCYRDSIFRIDGESLHKTVMPHEFWMKLFTDVSPCVQFEVHGTWGTYSLVV